MPTANNFRYRIVQIKAPCVHVNRIDQNGLQLHVRTFSNAVDATRFIERSQRNAAAAALLETTA